MGSLLHLGLDVCIINVVCYLVGLFFRAVSPTRMYYTFDQWLLMLMIIVCFTSSFDLTEQKVYVDINSRSFCYVILFIMWTATADPLIIAWNHDMRNNIHVGWARHLDICVTKHNGAANVYRSYCVHVIQIGDVCCLSTQTPIRLLCVCVSSTIFSSLIHRVVNIRHVFPHKR